MNFSQYNAFFGCGHCMQKGMGNCMLICLCPCILKGETVKTGQRGRVQCFPYIADDPTGPPRTHKQTCIHARDADTEGSTVSNDVKVHVQCTLVSHADDQGICMM